MAHAGIRLVRWFVVLVVAAVCAACGGGEGSGSGANLSGGEFDVRNVMTELLVAAADGDAGYAKVREHLAPKDFHGWLRQGAAEPWEKLTPAAQEEVAKSCYNQLLAVSKQTTLRDRATIEAALAAGKIEVLSQTRRADVHFQGPPEDGKGGPLKFNARLVEGADGKWRLVSCDAQFGK